MARTVSAAQVKSRLADYVRKAEGGETIMITRHGKPVAALVGADRVAFLEPSDARRGGRGLAALAGGWEDSADLVRALGKRRRTRTRRATSLDR